MYQIFNTDCLESLSTMDSEVFDLILSDPPYFPYKTSRRKDKDSKLSQALIYQDREDQIRTIQECVRVLKQDRAFFLFTNWEQDWWMQQALGTLLRNKIIWDKLNWCLSGDTKILARTPAGVDYLSLASLFPIWRKVELYTPNGFKPIQKMERTETIYKIIQAGGLELKASPDHIFPIKRSWWKSGEKIEEVPIKAIRKGSLLWHSMKLDIEDERFSYEDGWFTGFYLAEGYKVKNSKTAFRFVTGLHEEHFRRKLECYAEPYGTVWHTLQDHNAITGIHSGRLRNMIEFFITGNRAFNKELVMYQVLNTSGYFRKGLIEGFCDGDGMKDNKRLRLTTSSRELSEQLMVIASTLGAYSSRHFSKTSGFGGKGSYTVDLRGSQFWFGDKALVRIKDIHQVLIYQPMYDLQIEGGLFCINHGILTHNSAGDLSGSFGNQYEVILLGAKGKWKYKGKRESDIWAIPRMGTNRIHPTEKPVALYKKIIELATNEGDFILDTYGGSGSSAIAALELNRNILVYEIDGDYYKGILDRIKEAGYG